MKKGKNQHLNGRDALWFARSRSDSSDYDRMARQKCVMSAMLQQLDPVTVLTNFNKIAAAGKEIVATDIPTNRVDTMLDLAMKAKAKPISTIAFVPPTVYPGDPNFDKIHRMVADEVAASEAKDNPSAAPATPVAGSAAPSGSTSATPKPSSQSTKKTTASNASDVGAVCAASGQ